MSALTVAATSSVESTLPASRRRRVASTRLHPNDPNSASGLPAWWHAVPTGSVPARSQAGWLRVATAAIDDADLRTDADAALRALVWCWCGAWPAGRTGPDRC